LYEFRDSHLLERSGLVFLLRFGYRRSGDRLGLLRVVDAACLACCGSVCR
jgi:hypothetical protein